MMKQRFKTGFAERRFHQKYAQGPSDTWDALAERLVEDVCGSRWGTEHPLMSEAERTQLVEYIKEMKFLPGGRYLYYAGRPAKFYNNCYLLRAEEDTREEWADLAWRVMSCLMTGGGIGVDYSRIRASGKVLSRTGGTASGPLSLIHAINEIGRGVMQGGSRRSAIYASLNWQHEDAPLFLKAKNWDQMQIKGACTGRNDGTEDWFSIAHAKKGDFNYPAPLDMTNISLNYDDVWLNGQKENDPLFLENCRQAMSTGEPGFSFNFGEKRNETLRNAPLGGDTHVLTSKGYVPIREIVGETVQIWTGKQWASTVFKKTKEDVPTVKVILSGYRNIVADPSHEFLAPNWGKIRADELVPGQELLVSLPETKPFTQNPKGYTLGYIYGDGSFHQRYPRAEITFCTEESKQCVEALDHGMLTSINWEDSRGFVRVYTKNDSIFHQRSKEVFPYDLMDAGTDFLCSFVAGLFDSDGNYFKPQNRIRFSSKHFNFIKGVQHCLDQLGILSGISPTGTSTYGQCIGYQLTVYGDYVSRFAEIIPTKRLKTEPYKPYRSTKIVVCDVEPGDNQDVYCCDVGVEEHAFMAEGVLVSNCTEVVSEDDSDVCNLGSVNLGAISSLQQFKDVVALASKFLVCGTLRADLPYDKVYKVREKNRRLGLGLMGIHEWLLQRGMKYEVTPELHQWLQVYRDESKRSADEHCDRLYLSHPVAYRAIAPTGSIGILASTTTGIEPLFAVAYKRRFLTEGTKWHYEFVIDATADRLINDYDIHPETIDTAYKLSHDYEQRIKFQADVQDYVDMSISSTINLPSWGTKGNSDGDVQRFAKILSTYAPRLRGFTCYPDGSRGGQPITEVDYADALKHKNVVFEESDICELSQRGGTCGA